MRAARGGAVHPVWTWTSGIEALVVGKVAAAAPALARQKELKARRARFAKRVGKPEHGMARS